MTNHHAPRSVRVATVTDVDGITECLTTAFFHDPLWGAAFPDVSLRAMQASIMWRQYATSALRYPWTLVTEGVEAVAVWIPPGGSELGPEEQAGMRDLLLQTMKSEDVKAIFKIYEQLEAALPEEPYFYLTLLGVHDRHRGHGIGMHLPRESLERIDTLGAPAYLESSNPVNIARYASAGFTPRDEIEIATGHVVTTMWRPGR